MINTKRVLSSPCSTMALLGKVTDDLLRYIGEYVPFLRAVAACCRRLHECFALWRVRMHLGGTDALPRLLRTLPRVRRLQVIEPGVHSVWITA